MKILFLFLSLLWSVSFHFIPGKARAASGIMKSLQKPGQSNARQEAFQVLAQHCNVCHQTRNRPMIFTITNMDGFAQMINQQVFIKKRMPKGNTNNLSNIDSFRLKKWLNTFTTKFDH